MKLNTVSWNILKHWIHKKEVYEKENGEPAPLTLTERRALNAIVPGICPMPPQTESSTTNRELPTGQQHFEAQEAQRRPSSQRQRSKSPPRSEAKLPARTTRDEASEEGTPKAVLVNDDGIPTNVKVGRAVDPDYEKGDWISTLHHYMNTHNLSAPKVSFFSVELGRKVPLKWGCFCELPDKKKEFPCKASGLIDGQVPCFSSKKDAKQYAYKCALDFLCPKARPFKFQDQEPSHPAKATAPAAPATSAATPAAPEATANPPMTAALAAAEVEMDAETEDNGAKLDTDVLMSTETVSGPDPQLPILPADVTDEPRTKSTSRSPSRSNRKRNHDFDDEPDATDQVIKVCNRLGLRYPHFDMIASLNMPNFWDVRVNFGKHSHLVPEGLGNVDSILTRRAAKEASASRVLEWLLEHELEWRKTGLVSMRCD